MTKYLYIFSIISLLHCRAAKPVAAITKLTEIRFGDSTDSLTDTITQDMTIDVRGTIVTNSKEPYTNLILQVSKESSVGEQLLYKEYMPVGRDGRDTLKFDKSHTFNKPMTPGKSRLIIRLMVNDSVELYRSYKDVVIMPARPINTIKKDSAATLSPLTYLSKGVFYSNKYRIFRANQPTNFIIRLSRQFPSSVKRFKVHYGFDQAVTILNPADRIYETLDKDTMILLRDLIFVVNKPCPEKVTIKVSLIDLDTNNEFDIKQYSKSCGESLPPDIMELKESNTLLREQKQASHTNRSLSKRNTKVTLLKKKSYGRAPTNRTRKFAAPLPKRKNRSKKIKPYT